MPRYSYKRDSYLSRNEVLTMIEAAEESWLKALVALLYLYGMRISEALRLKPSDFKIEYKKWLACRIKVSKKRKTSGPIEPRHILRVSFKNKSLAPFLRPLIQYIADRKRQFPTDQLWRWNRRTVWLKLKKLSKNVSAHFFRHNRLYRLAEKGASAPVLKDWAGWADLRPASNYLEATGQLARKFADKIE